jgi:hypothetical protein
MHLMVMQGLRDRKTLRVNYPMANKKGLAGETNRQVFMHFLGMEITWK